MFRFEPLFEKMEEVALFEPEKTLVMRTGKKYFETKLSEHGRDFSSLMRGDTTYLIQLIKGVFDFNEVYPKKVLIGKYRNNVASALGFSDNSCSVPVKTECGILCNLVNNREDNVYGVQEELLKGKWRIKSPIKKLRFVNLKDLKCQPKNENIIVEKNNYDRFSFVNELKVLESLNENYHGLVYSNSIGKRCVFQFPTTISILDKISRRVPDAEVKEGIRYFLNSDDVKRSVKSEIEILDRILKKNKTNVEGFINFENAEPKNLGYQTEIDFIIMSLEGGNRKASFKAPYIQGMGLTFLNSDEIRLKEKQYSFYT